jgi:hypothetical protein
MSVTDKILLRNHGNLRSQLEEFSARQLGYLGDINFKKQKVYTDMKYNFTTDTL